MVPERQNRLRPFRNIQTASNSRSPAKFTRKIPAMINIGIVGYGYWGPNLVRNFYAVDTCCVRAVADARPERLVQLNKLFPGIIPFADADELITDPLVDAVVIATPVQAHFLLAKKALMHGKHVLIEKPMTASVQEAEI